MYNQNINGNDDDILIYVHVNGYVQWHTNSAADFLTLSHMQRTVNTYTIKAYQDHKQMH